MSKGMVTLVGAGPGNAGLLSRAGEEALSKAQVVLYDRLVGVGVLALAPPGAELIDVGKESGHHPVPQHEINAVIIRHARAGRRVVRLKGGDPYLFGRGAEELAGVREADIPFRVVPGITAAVAVPAWAGIPVTHRDFSSSLHIMTGHARQGKTQEIDFESLVKVGGTLVFFMSFTAMEGILEGLLSAGLDPDMPAALIQEGTLPTQRRVVATARTLPEQVRKAGLKPPALLVVGRVCTLADELDWCTGLPLSGRTVLVTRPLGAEGTLAGALEALGGGVIPYPCIHTEGIAQTSILDTLDQYGWIAFTSSVGVDTFFTLFQKAKYDIRSLASLRFAAVGSRTAERLERHGILTDYVPDTYDAVHLAQGLAEVVQAGARVLLFRAESGAPELPDYLEESGIPFTDYPAYRTHYANASAPQIADQLLAGQIDLVTFTSASTVEGFVCSVGNEAAGCGRFTGLCIGKQTAQKAAGYGIKTVISPQATVESMVEAAVVHCQQEKGAVK